MGDPVNCPAGLSPPPWVHLMQKLHESRASIRGLWVWLMKLLTSSKSASTSLTLIGTSGRTPSRGMTCAEQKKNDQNNPSNHARASGAQLFGKEKWSSLGYFLIVMLPPSVLTLVASPC